MIAYFIELAIIHLALTLVYMFTMRGERQYQLMRFLLLFTIPVAVIVPLISFEGFLGTNTGGASTELNSIMTHSLSPIVVGTQSAIDQYAVLTWVYLLITSALLLYFLAGLGSIWKLVRKSTPATIDGIRTHLIKERGSFTFLKWIFIHEEAISDKDHQAILHHELAHAQQLHSLDTIIVNIFRIFCWFLPSAWWLQKEMKKIHEYDADRIALKQFNLSDYSNTLIKHTLKANGWALANSFHGGSVLKRIHAMKNQMKYISGWKLATLGTLYAVLITTFACNNELDKEIEKIAEGAVLEAEIPPQAKELIEELHSKHPEKTYAYKELAVEEGEEVGTVYDILRKLHVEGNMVSFFYLKDRIGVVVELKDYMADAQSSKAPRSNQVFTIVENQPEFPGGLQAFYKYISENLKYPSTARSIGIEGRVYVEFIVDEEGSITEVKAIKGIGAGCDQEAERVLRNAPRFNPGREGGETVKVKMVLPIIFKLDRSAGT
ncbi:MAG: TonB family protein [Cyclobacteriaceae bacterium]|nr:TonB family protein [Cyclobacteriaceae bacterium SS2]